MRTSPHITDASPALLDTRAPTVNGVFEPPSSFAVIAVARNKLLVLVCAATAAVAGLGLGLERKAVYTASATLQVGQVNPNSPGFYGYVQSAASLATAFSRAVGAEPVLATVQHKLKLAPSLAVARLSAEPIPLSPTFRVIATGPTAAASIRLANVAAGAVIAYESESNSANPQATSLLGEYRAASIRLDEAAQHLSRLTRAKHASITALANAEAERNTALVKLRAIGVAYTSAITSQAPRSGLLSLLSGATSTSNDRRAKIELSGFIGLIAGMVLGCIAALLWERRRLDREAGASGRAEVAQPPHV
jgi:hypothetical protein